MESVPNKSGLGRSIGGSQPTGPAVLIDGRAFDDYMSSATLRATEYNCCKALTASVAITTEKHENKELNEHDISDHTLRLCNISPTDDHV